MEAWKKPRPDRQHTDWLLAATFLQWVWMIEVIRRNFVDISRLEAGGHLSVPVGPAWALVALGGLLDAHPTLSANLYAAALLGLWYLRRLEGRLGLRLYRRFILGLHLATCALCVILLSDGLNLFYSGLGLLS